MFEALHPKDWTPSQRYTHGIATTGKFVFVSGQIGINESRDMVSDDFSVQTQVALQNIIDIIAEAGGKPEHIAQLTWYVTDIKTYEASAQGVAQAYRSTIGNHLPTMTMVQVGRLIVDRAQVEISAIAVLPEST